MLTVFISPDSLPFIEICIPSHSSQVPYKGCVYLSFHFRGRNYLSLISPTTLKHTTCDNGLKHNLSTYKIRIWELNVEEQPMNVFATQHH